MKGRVNYLAYLYSFAVHLVIAGILLSFSVSREDEEEDFVSVGFGTGIPGDFRKQIVKDTPELPAAKNKDEKSPPVPEKVKKKKETKREETSGSGNSGYNIDFGGKRIRKIYSYEVPPYPEGVAKDIDVKLRFTILPDGTVGSIFPLIKADSRLETAAVSALRRWRFEPLPAGQKKEVQHAVIVFPFRLK